MKKIIFALLLINNIVTAQIGLETIIVEKYYISDANDAKVSGGHLPVGSVTYRIYVDMLPNYKFQAAYGLPGHELRLATTTSFFNNEEKGVMIGNLIQDRSLDKGTLMLDSWLTVGAASYENFGTLKTDDDGVNTTVNVDGILQNSDSAAGIPIKTQDGLIPFIGKGPRVSFFGIDSIVKVLLNNTNKKNNGAVLSTTAGSWMCLKGVSVPFTENRILIAQLTTDGILSFELNIQIGAPDGSIQKFVAKNPVGEEIQHSSLIYSSGIAKPSKKKKK
jgi:hypothetical protein